VNVSSQHPDNENSSLAKIADGDRDALAQWFRCNKDSLYSFIFFRVGSDPDLAADVTQATFTAALEQLDRFDSSRGDMITWLRYLSRNIIRDTLVRHQRGVQLQTVWDRLDESLRLAFQRIESELLPDEVLQQKETREMVEMTLANLPPDYRQVLEAKYVDNQPLRTIAELRESTVDAVKSMLKRARAAFRECFLAIAKMEMSDV